MAAPFESVIFLPEEAQFVQNTMFAFSQNQALGNNSDAGAATPITRSERAKALSIVDKVRGQIAQSTPTPISFAEDEAQLMLYLYTRYIQCHGKPQGDLDWTYWVRLDTNSTQLVVNVLRKLGSQLPNFAPLTYPQGFDPFPRL